MLVEIINVSAAHISSKENSGSYFLMYLFSAVFVLTAQRIIYKQAFELVEQAANKLRKRISFKIGQIDLETFERIGQSTIYARLTQDVHYIAHVALHLIIVIQSISIVFCMLIYISSLSFWAFLMVFIGIVMILVSYFNNTKHMVEHFDKLTEIETSFFEQFDHIVKGFKEIKLNHQKNKEVFANYNRINDSKRAYRVDYRVGHNRIFILSKMFMFIMVGIIIFIVPQYHEEHASTIIKITAVILFILGPMEAGLDVIPNLAVANNGAQNVIALEKEIDEGLRKQDNLIPISTQTVAPLSFKHSIELKGLIYEYNSNDPAHVFSIGPMNLTIKKGELLFITGGNGAGKSTFLKMFTGLYLPVSGTIHIDPDKRNGKEGTRISVANYHQYSELFSIIFTDFHLFDKLYGVGDIDPHRVNAFLRRMNLSAEKTTFHNGRFSNISLSSGQKKRLALVSSIIEDKEIYIFDEVASDLDPDFRDVYYRELLEELKARNKTVLVVSHDKSYWDVADRVLLLERGVFREIPNKVLV